VRGHREIALPQSGERGSGSCREHLKTLSATYLQATQEAISRYDNDAAINSLCFDRHQERTAVEVFLNGLKLATDGFLDDPLGVPMISNGNRVAAAVPDIFGQLLEAVEADHEWEPVAALVGPEPVNG
jgi:glucosyl-3-phosphoglycerate synthase